MIYEHRSYTLPHGQMEAYLTRYEQHGLPVQLKHLGRLLGFWVTEIGPLNQVVHIWAYDSHADRERRRIALDADPAWRLRPLEKSADLLKLCFPARKSGLQFPRFY